MLTGPLIFIGPLPVGRASDSQRGPVFLARPDGQIADRDRINDGQTALTCFFVGFITYFMTYVRVSVASA